MQSTEKILNVFDLLLIPFFLVIIFFISYVIKNRNQIKIPEYNYFVKGLFFKIFGASAFALTYLFYYNGGDTTNYFIGAQCLSKLFWLDFNSFYDITINNNLDFNNYSILLENNLNPPWYMWRDSKTFTVCRYVSVFSLLGFNSFFITSFLTAVFSYIGIWKLYRLFNLLYPGNSKVFAYLILFLPTLIFWGGGIMKDSFVLGSTCWISYNFYQVFISRKKKLINLILLIFNLTIILSLKPYVVISLVPGMLLWINSAYLKIINNKILKALSLPFLIGVIMFAGFLLFENLSSSMGVYGGVETAIEQAQVIQDDLSRTNQYGDNYYSIGKIEGSLSSLLRVAPLAIFTALFRPLFWEIGSPAMVLSALENSILLVFTIVILIRTNPYRLIKIIFKEPFILYCFIFSLLMAYGVGIAGTNFGALVRYKTPLVPFFFTMMYIIFKKSKKTIN